MTNQDGFQVSGGAQNQYEETPYEDASWEIVGAVSDELEFLPMELEVLHEEDIAIDPMFADYGGVLGQGAPRRWHLPEDLAVRGPEDRSEAEEEEIALVKLREEELAQIKQQAFEEGRQAGLEEGARQSTERLQAVEQSFGGILPDLQAQVTEILKETERQAVELALSIAKKIIDTAVEINPEYIVRVIHDALDQTGSAVVKKIRVSPQDMEFVEVIGLHKQFDADGEWSWEADPSIRAGCVVETSAGEIDFQLDKAWERVRDQVVRVIR